MDVEGLDNVVFSFEDTGEGLSLLPLAARRALDVAGFRLSLEGYQSLGDRERRDLAIAGSRDNVDASAIERLLRRSSVPPTRIRPVPEPDPLVPPEQLNTALGSRRAVDPAAWARLRALDRYALVHVLRRSIARDDPSLLGTAASVILPARQPSPVRQARREAPPEDESPPPASTDASMYDDVDGMPAVLLSFGAASKRSPNTTPTVEPSPAPSPVAPRVAPREEREEPPSARASFARERGQRNPEPESPLGGRLAREEFARARPEPREEPVRSRADAREEPSRARPEPREEVRSVRRPAPRSFEEVGGARSAGANRAPEEEAPPQARSFAREERRGHVNAAGEVHMVDVADKPETRRRAVACGSVHMSPAVAERISRNDAPKGEVLATARVAGIMAAKRTHELIPLCHPIALTSVEVTIDVDARIGRVDVRATAEATYRTGVEMEALTAASIACLTIYDMVKGLDREMVIGEVKLLEKSGGRGGTYVRDGA